MVLEHETRHVLVLLGALLGSEAAVGIGGGDDLDVGRQATAVHHAVAHEVLEERHGVARVDLVVEDVNVAARVAERLVQRLLHPFDDRLVGETAVHTQVVQRRRDELAHEAHERRLAATGVTHDDDRNAVLDAQLNRHDLHNVVDRQHVRRIDVLVAPHADDAAQQCERLVTRDLAPVDVEAEAVVLERLLELAVHGLVDEARVERDDAERRRHQAGERRAALVEEHVRVVRVAPLLHLLKDLGVHGRLLVLESHGLALVHKQSLWLLLQLLLLRLLEHRRLVGCRQADRAHAKVVRGADHKVDDKVLKIRPTEAAGDGDVGQQLVVGDLQELMEHEEHKVREQHPRRLAVLLRTVLLQQPKDRCRIELLLVVGMKVDVLGVEVEELVLAEGLEELGDELHLVVVDALPAHEARGLLDLRLALEEVELRRHDLDALERQHAHKVQSFPARVRKRVGDLDQEHVLPQSLIDATRARMVHHANDHELEQQGVEVLGRRRANVDMERLRRTLTATGAIIASVIGGCQNRSNVAERQVATTSRPREHAT